MIEQHPLRSGPFLRVTLANFFFFLNFASFFLLPLYIKQLGGDEATVGAIMGSGGLAGLVVLPAVGASIDRIGRRRFLVAGAVGMMLLSVAFLLIEHLGPGIFALRVLQGVSFSLAFTAASTLAVEFAPLGRRAEAARTPSPPRWARRSSAGAASRRCSPSLRPSPRLRWPLPRRYLVARRARARPPTASRGASTVSNGCSVARWSAAVWPSAPC